MADLVKEELIETGILKYLIFNYTFLRELIIYDTHIEYLYDTVHFLPMRMLITLMVFQTISLSINARK